MHSSSIIFKSSIVHYTYNGAGEKLLFCFHGYGETEHSFHFLENHLPSSYFIVAIDMPYHGNTLWKEGMNFSVDDLLVIIESIKRKHGFDGKPFSMIAFSMGGRMALSVLQAKKELVMALILLAPDGLKLNFWYWLSTQTIIGNKIFAATIHNPGWFLSMLKLFNHLGVLNQSVYKFVNHFLHDKQKRKQLYLRWTCLRKIRPDLATIKQIIRQNNTPVHLLYGQHDRIILPSRGEKFRKGIEANCTLDILNCGHQVLQEKNMPDILKYLPR